MANKSKEQQGENGLLEDFRDYDGLFSSGRVIEARKMMNEEGVDARGMTLEDFAGSYPTKYWDAVIDMSPWNIIEFYNDKNGFRKMKEEVLKLGFKLTEKEEKSWNKFINGR